MRRFREQKASAAEFGDLTSIPRIQMMEGQDQLPHQNILYAREMTEQLKTYISLAEALRLVPSIHITQLTTYN